VLEKGAVAPPHLAADVSLHGSIDSFISHGRGPNNPSSTQEREREGVTYVEPPRRRTYGAAADPAEEPEQHC
jgi:hypothetical protein